MVGSMSSDSTALWSRLADVVGLDVCKHVGEIIGNAIGRSPALPLRRLEQLVEARQLGRKTGQGYYRWANGKAVKMPVDESAVPAELTDRLMLTLANESVATLREGIVADADLDVIQEVRDVWQFYRDRRPESYGAIVQP